MTKRTKRLFFYSAVALFLALGYIVLLYAQGYRYSLSEGKFQRTGAISLKVNTGARVFLDDELQGGTSFFNNSFSIDQLLPKNYKLNVQEEGYSSWTKVAGVEEGLVVDFPNIMLLPKDGTEKEKLIQEIEELFKEISPSPTPKPLKTSGPAISPAPDSQRFVLEAKTRRLYENSDEKKIEVASSVRGFSLSKNENKIAWWTSNELWIMWLNDTDYQPYYKSGDRELITRFALPIQNGSWFRGEDHIILEFERRDFKNRPYSAYKVIEIDKRGGLNIIEL